MFQFTRVELAHKRTVVAIGASAPTNSILIESIETRREVGGGRVVGLAVSRARTTYWLCIARNLNEHYQLQSWRLRSPSTLKRHSISNITRIHIRLTCSIRGFADRCMLIGSLFGRILLFAGQRAISKIPVANCR